MAKRHVRLSQHAQRFMANYLSDMGAQNPAAARKIVQRFRALRQKLADFPRMAQPGRLADTRRVVMRPLIFAIPVNDTGVDILAARHERQSEPDSLQDIGSDE